MNNHKSKITLIIFTLFLTIGIYAQGRPGGGQGGGRGQGGGNGEQRREKPSASKILAMLDTNDDGVIDKDEASKDRRGKISEDFDEIDLNDDQVINLEELEASLDGKKPKKISAEKVLKKVDQNEDGFLNELEVAAKDRRELMDNFHRIDSNEDGQLDLEELQAFYLKEDKTKRKRKD